ncbi:MAG: AAA family ATPase [Egibacteraceae bacterium]
MPPLVHHITLENYKSIEYCSVELGSLTFLVGPNGSGKSNFLDALRFVSDALNDTAAKAVESRGGVWEISTRERDQGLMLKRPSFGIRLRFELEGAQGSYTIRIGGIQRRIVAREQCILETDQGRAFFDVGAGSLRTSSLKDPPPVPEDRLYLVNAAGREEFRGVYDVLSGTAFYNFNPDEMRVLRPSGVGIGTRLSGDGANIASVLGLLEDEDPDTKQHIDEYLTRIVPGLAEVQRKPLGTHETLEFRQDVGGSRAWRFPSASMSDGTLRALGILVALFQGESGPEGHPRLVGIEEPELALHPGASGLLLDALREASVSRQVIVTSHSPDLLDDKRIRGDQIIAVASVDGTTRLGQLDAPGRRVLQEQLSTPGELLRHSELAPEEVAAQDHEPLFVDLP